MAMQKTKAKAIPAPKSVCAAPVKTAKKIDPKAEKGRNKTHPEATIPSVTKGNHSLTHYLIVRDTAAAMDFYAKTLGAKENGAHLDGCTLPDAMTVLSRITPKTISSCRSRKLCIVAGVLDFRRGKWARCQRGPVGVIAPRSQPVRR